MEKENKRLVGVVEVSLGVFEFATPELGKFNIGGKKNLEDFFKRKGWDFYIRNAGINKNKF